MANEGGVKQQSASATDVFARSVSLDQQASWDWRRVAEGCRGDSFQGAGGNHPGVSSCAIAPIVRWGAVCHESEGPGARTVHVSSPVPASFPAFDYASVWVANVSSPRRWSLRGLSMRKTPTAGSCRRRGSKGSGAGWST